MSRFVALIPRFSRLGIRGRLLVLALCLGLPFLAYVGVSATRAYAVERAHAEREVLGTAWFVAARLDDDLGSMQLLLEALRLNLGRDRPRAQPLDTPGVLDALLGQLPAETTAPLRHVSLWSADGRELAVSRRPLEVALANVPGSRYFADVLRTGRPAVAAPVRTARSDEWVAVFAAPVPGSAAGGTAAVLVVAVRMDRFQNLLDPAGVLPPDGVITVFDRDGIVVSRSLDAERWVGRHLMDLTTRRDVVADRAGVIERGSFDGVPRLFGHAPLKTVPWAIYVGVPVDFAIAPARARLVDSLAFGAATLLLGGLFAAGIAGSIARPLARLQRDAERLGKGDLAHRSAVHGPPEVERLAATLNHAAQSLEQQNDALLVSRALLRKATDHVPALVSLLDRDGCFRFANEAYRLWLGQDPREMIGRSLEDVYGAAAYRTITPRLRRAWAGERTVYERTVETTSGPRACEVTMIPLRDEGGEVVELCVMILDITERRQAQALLARSEERLSLALESSEQALFDLDVVHDLEYQSAQAAALRGEPPVQALLDREQRAGFVHPEDRPGLNADIARVLKGDTDRLDTEFRVRHADGRWTWLRRCGRVVERDGAGRALRVAGTDADVTERRDTEQRLRERAESDTLTGLPNRGLFGDRLHQALRRAVRHTRSLAVLFVDVDQFKSVNDRHGHAAGDQVLRTMARRLSAGVRTSDTVARFAGDEFTLILETLREPQDAAVVATQLVVAAREPVAFEGQLLQVSLSIGIAVWRPGDGLDETALLAAADAALYEAKRLGRDRWHLAGPPGLSMSVEPDLLSGPR